MVLLLLLRELSIKTKTVGLHIYLKSNLQPKNPFFNLLVMYIPKEKLFH